MSEWLTEVTVSERLNIPIEEIRAFRNEHLTLSDGDYTRKGKPLGVKWSKGAYAKYLQHLGLPPEAVEKEVEKEEEVREAMIIRSWPAVKNTTTVLCTFDLKANPKRYDLAAGFVPVKLGGRHRSRRPDGGQEVRWRAGQRIMVKRMDKTNWKLHKRIRFKS